LLLVPKQSRLNIPLVASMVVTVLVILVATAFGKEIVKTVSDIMYIPITGIFVGVAAMMTRRFGFVGSHGKAWLMFLGAATSWCLAETTWAIYDLVYNQNPFPSVADIFYVVGYPLFFGFLMYYIKPVKKAITRKMLVTAIVIAACLAIPCVYIAYSSDPKVTLLENLLSTAYPVGDAILLVPALLGISLFFRGEVSFSWTIICIGIVFFTIGDIGFQITTFNNTYYAGHPVDIILMCSYILFSFGAIDHLRIFKKEKTNEHQIKRYSDDGI
jgi:hypothetical protein